jgi:hypothetical protein
LKLSKYHRVLIKNKKPALNVLRAGCEKQWKKLSAHVFLNPPVVSDRRRQEQAKCSHLCVIPIISIGIIDIFRVFITVLIHPSQ